MNRLIIIIAVVFSTFVYSCKKDDKPNIDIIPARDRSEEAIPATAEIESYLATHFYNYENFENPPADFDYKIKLDTIAGDNASKIPLRDQVSMKTVPDRVKDGLSYTLYYLVVREGEGDQIHFPDIATMVYEGRLLNNELFDSAESPIRFDLTGIIDGLQDALIQFKGATGSTVNPDGTVSFNNYGIGAVFMQSGLGYYVSPPPGSDIPLYSQLIFTFQLYAIEEGDQDRDGVPSIVEDVNQNGLEEDDDTDLDLIPNFADNDDDNDGRPTADEIIIESDGTITYPDVDNDGIPDYLDSDS